MAECVPTKHETRVRFPVSAYKFFSSHSLFLFSLLLIFLISLFLSSLFSLPFFSLFIHLLLLFLFFFRLYKKNNTLLSFSSIIPLSSSFLKWKWGVSIPLPFVCETNALPSELHSLYCSLTYCFSFLMSHFFFYNKNILWVYKMHPVGFEPTHLSIAVLETAPLDRSGTNAYINVFIINKAIMQITSKFFLSCWMGWESSNTKTHHRYG